MKSLIPILLISLLLIPAKTFSDIEVVRYFQRGDNTSFHAELLKLALDRTVSSDGPYRLEFISKNITYARKLFFLEHGDLIDIEILATNREREQRFLPIRVPLLYGLLGYRSLMIRNEDLDEFKDIKTLRQLNERFKAGFNSHWADMKILKANNIPVIEAVKLDSLLKMLEGGRFDYFPRGLSEIPGELKNLEEDYPTLTEEPTIALYYPFPVYYFVNKSNQRLADRVERGLKLLIKDGSFRSLFLKHYRDVIRRANLKGRKIFTLENPTLPPQTPPLNSDWWRGDL